MNQMDIQMGAYMFNEWKRSDSFTGGGSIIFFHLDLKNA